MMTRYTSISRTRNTVRSHYTWGTQDRFETTHKTENSTSYTGWSKKADTRLVCRVSAF